MLRRQTVLNWPNVYCFRWGYGPVYRSKDYLHLVVPLSWSTARHFPLFLRSVDMGMYANDLLLGPRYHFYPRARKGTVRVGHEVICLASWNSVYVPRVDIIADGAIR